MRQSRGFAYMLVPIQAVTMSLSQDITGAGNFVKQRPLHPMLALTSISKKLRVS